MTLIFPAVAGKMSHYRLTLSLDEEPSVGLQYKRSRGPPRPQDRHIGTAGRSARGRRRVTFLAEEYAVPYTLVSGDDHTDLSYCPPNRWSSQAPAEWMLLIPRVGELGASTR